MRSIRVMSAFLLVVLMFPASPVSADEEIDKINEERKANQEEQAIQAGKIEIIEADAAEVLAALTALATDVSNKKEDLDDAQFELQFAQDKAALASSAEERAANEVRDLQVGLRDLAVASYASPGGNGLFVALSSGNIIETKQRQVYESLTAGIDVSVLDQYRVTTEDLAARRELAKQYVVEADLAQERTDADLAALGVAKDRQSDLLDDVEDRLDRALSEAAALEAVDADLARQVRAREAEIARLLEKARQEAARKRKQRERGEIPDRSDIVKVQGIWVHKDIALQVEGLFLAAAQAGINLSGGGYRSSESQIRLRRAHCGTSQYAIYEAPSYKCRPPTARPGSSMHERGKAIDITYNGRVITSRSSEAFKWLKAHAAEYGMYNLPSEPWHWSTNGN